MSHTIDQRIRQSWTAAGGDAAQLPAKALRWLSERIGVLNPTPVAPSPTVPVSALDDGARAELVALLGDENVLATPEERLGRAGGLSYLDLLRRRGIGLLQVPDAVVLPADPEQAGLGTISHHHAVGVEHAAYLGAEIG